jgi:hypothetical protein
MFECAGFDDCCIRVYRTDTQSNSSSSGSSSGSSSDDALQDTGPVKLVGHRYTALRININSVYAYFVYVFAAYIL